MLGLFFSFLALASCGGDDTTPKPKGYYRIEFPEKAYRKYESNRCPFTFEYPSYAKLDQDSTFFQQKAPNPCWLNIQFPKFSGVIHISYKQINKKKSLPKLIEDMHRLTFKHTIKADYIDKKSITGKSKEVDGLLYDVGGNAASSTQFFLTDSSRHFLRGALYFKTSPNQDSMAPVINFVKEDILHMVKSFRWTGSSIQTSN